MHTVQVDLLRDSVMDGRFQKRREEKVKAREAVFHSAASGANDTSVPRR
jgi:hypothetical protein